MLTFFKRSVISRMSYPILNRNHLIAVLLVMSLGLSFATLSPLAAQEPIEATLAMPAPVSLDPVGLSRFDLNTRDLVENLFVGLTRFNARTGQIEPMLAESWTVSADNLTWTFSLREDIQWVSYNPTSGAVEALRPVVASDVVYALQRACDAMRPSPLTTNLFVISGCRVLANADPTQPIPLETLQVFALDDTTLQVQLLFPASYLLTLTTLPEFRPLPAEMVSLNELGWSRPATLVTSGMWAVESWVEGGTMRMIRNPLWQSEFEGNVEVVNVRFDFFQDAIPTDFASGFYDFARLSPSLVQAGAVPQEQLSSSEGRTLTLLGFSFGNVTPEGLPQPSPLDSAEVRRAFALALDRDVLASVVYGVEGQGSEHFTPRTAVAGPSAPGAAYDPATARLALARGGYPDCTGLGQLTFAVSSEPADLLLAQNMVTQWQNNLGCPVDAFIINQVPRAAILDSAHNTVDVVEGFRFPLWLITWSADYPDAQSWVGDAVHCDYGYFRGRNCDRVDTLIDQAALLNDITDRFTVYNQIETDLFGSQGTFPVIPLVFEQIWWAKQPWLSGVANFGVLQFDRWVIEK